MAGQCRTACTAAVGLGRRWGQASAAAAALLLRRQAEATMTRSCQVGAAALCAACAWMPAGLRLPGTCSSTSTPSRQSMP